MSSTLDDLFQQIIQSEQRAERRKNLLNEVKSDIETCKLRIQETEEDTSALRGKLVLKTHQLNNEDLNLKWLATREVILRTQLEKFQLDLKMLEKKLLESHDQMQKEYERFCAQTREFTKCYSLVENGQEMRNGKANRHLVVVMEEKNLLEEDLQTYKKMKSIVFFLEEQKEAVRARLDMLLAEEKDLQDQVKVENQKIDSAEHEKTRVSEIPHTGTEFTKLQKELDILKTQNYEKDCQELQQELQKLQQCLWQKQVKSQSRVLPVARHPRRLPLASCQVLQQPHANLKTNNVLKVSNFCKSTPESPTEFSLNNRSALQKKRTNFDAEPEEDLT